MARLASHALAKLRVDVLPSAVLLPKPEVVEHDAVWRQIVRQAAPRAAVAGQVQHGVNDLAALILSRASAMLRFRNPRRNPPPLGIRQVGGIGVPSHAT